jgi:predicted TIM-barrel fold metal-dependent hydrolase
MIIDCHTHASGGRSFGVSSVPVDDFVDVMDHCSIDRSLVYTTDGFFFDFVACNDELQAFVRQFPDRLVAGPTVDPRYRDESTAELHRCRRDLGMKGPLKLHPWLQGFCPTEPLMDPIAETAIELGMPIMFHDGTPAYSTSLQAAALAARFPDLTVILGHSGLRDLWQTALAAALRYPNIVLCLCGTLPLGIDRIVSEVDPERLLFGTDAGFGAARGNQEYRLGQILRLAIPDRVKALILGGNAQRIFDLD